MPTATSLLVPRQPENFSSVPRNNEDKRRYPTIRRTWPALAAVLSISAILAGCNARPILPPGHEGGATPPYPLTYTKQAENPSLRYGMFYSPENYRHCLKLYRTPPGKSMAGCEYLRLTRPDIPEYWPNGTPPPIQFPPPPVEPTYKPGMTSEQYFNALCEKESGDFVFQTAKDVDGVYLVRPRYYQGDQIRRELFANEAPYEETGLLQLGVNSFSYLSKIYQFVEFPVVESFPAQYIPPVGESGSMRLHFRNRPGTGPYWHYWWDEEIDRNDRSANPRYFRKRVAEPQSRYGITWRAIERTGFDRDLGVAGIEVLIVDLRSGEVLAVRRGFARALMGRPTPFHGHTGNIWGRDLQCPGNGVPAGTGSETVFRDFLTKVLTPTPPSAKISKGD